MNRAEKRRAAKRLGAPRHKQGASRIARKLRAGALRTDASDQLDALLEQARQQQEIGNNEASRSLLLEILHKEKSYADAHNALGIIEVESNKVELAIRWFKKAVKFAPDRAAFHNNLGLALLSKDKFRDALKAFEDAIKADPQFVPAFANLAQVYNQLGKPREAIQNLKSATEVAPDFVPAFRQLAEAYSELGELEPALKANTRAQELDPDSTKHAFQRGAILTQFGKLTEAEEVYRAITIKFPNLMSGYASLAAVKKIDNYDEDLRKMEEFYDRVPDVRFQKETEKNEFAPTDADSKMFIALKLADALEKVGEHQKAFKFLIEGKRLKRKKHPYSQSNDFRSFDAMIELFTPAFIKRYEDLGYSDPTPIFIVGMPRSGTTLLEQVLHSHRDVYGAGELKYFGHTMNQILPGGLPKVKEDFESGSVPAEKLRDVGERYVEQIRELDPKAKFIVDKLPHNFMYVGFIKLALPNSKIIFSSRNPIDNSYAIFRINFAEGHFYGNDLVELGAYHNKFRELMIHWNDVFPGQILENRYEDMVEDLEGQTRKVLDFCGLDWDPNCLTFYEAERSVRTASITQVRQPVYKTSVEKWRKYEEQLQPLIKTLRRGPAF